MTQQSLFGPFRRLGPVLLVVLLVAAALGDARAIAIGQPPPSTFPSRIEQVIVDVVVVDGKGNPVTDLRPESVEVYEDGVRQSVASFDLFEVPAAAAAVPAAAAPSAPPVRSPVSTNVSPSGQRGRTFVILFDDAHLGPRTALRAKTAIAEFLRTQTREGDHVTLLAASGGVWWTARLEQDRPELLELLKRLESRLAPETRRDWVSDYEAMRIHVFHDNQIIDRVQRRFETYGIQTLTEQSRHVRDMMAVEDPVVTTRATEVYYEAVARNHVTLGALERALDALAGVKGRKSVVLVSEGFVYDNQLPEFKRILDASRRVNAAIYFVNARGLEGLPDALGAEYGAALPEEDTGSALAQEARSRWPPTAAASPSATPTTSPAASSASRTRRAPTT
jgi:VWFA-related protein